MQQIKSIMGAYAWCSLRRHLKCFIDQDVAFSAILVVDEPIIAKQFEEMARLIFAAESTGTAQADDGSVQRVPKGQVNTEDLLRTGAHRRSVLVFENEDDVPNCFRHSASVFAKIGQPDIVSLRAAAFKFFGIRISDRDANILRHFSLSDLAYAFRDPRSFERGMSGIRRMYSPMPEQMSTARKAISKAFSRVKEVPVRRRSNPDLLRILSGYGLAVDWGLQLCRDLDDYREGKIKWNAVERGLLLYGPPGTGKTRFATRLAEACDVPIFVGSYAAWQKEGHQGDMLKAMSKVFADARKNAPAIVAIDELDGFVNRSSRRNGESDTYMRGVVNGLLEQLDGGRGREGVVVVAMTNDISSVDPAILRSNRIDTHIEISLPDNDARCAIIEGYLGSSVPAEIRGEVIERTFGSSGSDLEVHVKRAHARARLQDTLTTARHLLDVLPPLITAPDELRWAAAIHEAGHVVLGIVLRRVIIRAEVARHYVAGRRDEGNVRFEPRPLSRNTRAQLEEDIMLLLAGVSAERELLGEHDVAGSGTLDSDLAKATILATRIELVHGMGKSLSSEVLNNDGTLDRLRQLNSNVASRVDAVLQGAMLRTCAVISANISILEALARELMDREAMSGEEIVDFLDTNALVVSTDDCKPDSPKGVAL